MKQSSGWLQENRMVNDRMLFGSILLIVTAVVLVPVQAQNQSGSDQPSRSGEVTGDKVRLRGGPGTKFKPVGTINQGTQLQVRGEEGNWTEVVPPEQATVWIYGKFIEETNEDQGRVTATSVNIRPLPRVDQTNVPLGQVSNPKTVTLVDRKKRSDDEFPWYEIQVPQEFSVWIHSDYVQALEDGSDQDSEGGAAAESEDQQASGESSSGSSSSQAGPQKGAAPANGPQKGSSEDGGANVSGSDGTSTSGEATSESGNASEWVDRLESIQERVRNERNREDKLDWDFSSHIQDLETYAQNVPVNRLETRADELRQKLEGLQEKVRKEQASLNERLRKIQEARKAQVQNTIQSVLQAKGFTWDAIGHVRSVGNLYYERPAQFELVKGGQRTYFLQSARDILKLSNYRGLQVAVSGTEISPDGKQWGVPILRVEKIEPISN